jgi:ComF family protein
MFSISKLKEFFLNALFPEICIHCKGPLPKNHAHSVLCDMCISNIFVHTTFFCSQCIARLPSNKKICHKNSRFLLAAATNYDGAMRNLIHQLKYRHWQRTLPTIERLVGLYLDHLRFSQPSFEDFNVIPIPLAKERERERGFNQAELIGRIISNQLRIPFTNNILLRSRETRSQTEFKNWNDRKSNISGAFRIPPSSVKNQNIILVDDVYTSGATMHEAVKILKDNGAKQVIAFVLSKAR